LFDLSNYDRGVPGRQYDVAPDGQHFLLVKVGSAADPSRIVVVENWTDELKHRVPRH
jgi:hypothetical protein